MSRDALQTGAGTSNDDAPEPLSRIAGEPVRSTDPVRAYLREIGRAALLSAAEEVDLAKRIEVGHAFVQNLRRGHYELGFATEPGRRLEAT